MMIQRFRRLFGLPTPPVVSVLRLSGIIGSGAGPLRAGLSLAGVAGLLERAFALPGQAAVALVINSPGGSPVQSSLIGRRIRALADEKKLPVYAFVEDVAASGGYWIACAADEIIVDAGSIVGSIGVISQGFGFHEAIGRLGIERRLYTAGSHKSLLDPFKPENPDDVGRLRAVQDELHQDFQEWVRARRATKLKTDGEDLFSGAFWTGRRGVALGLADRIGDARSVLRETFGDKVRLRVVGARKPLFRPRLRMADAGVLSGPQPEPVSGMAPELARALGDGLLSALEERALWARFGL